MVRIIKYVVAGLIVILGLFFLGKHLLNVSTNKRAAYVLAQVVSTQDDDYADMAMKTLIDLKDPGAIPALEQGLKEGNTSIKVRAIKVLDALDGDQPRDLLLIALSDPDELVSANASLALARRGVTEVLDLARERARSSDPEIVGISFEVLGYLEDGYLDTLEGILNGNDPTMMPSAVRGLVPIIERGEDKAWRLLKRGINSRYENVRNASFNAAVKLGGEYRVEALTSAVDSSDPALRKAALQEMTAGNDGGRFLETLKLALNDDDIGAKFAAAWGLYKLRDATPVAYMRLLLNDKETSLPNRIIAARILARLGDPQGADPMYDILDDVEVSEDLKLEAAEVLGEYDEIRGMGYLGEAIKPDRPMEIRQKALDMLAVMGDRNAEVLLLEMAREDPDKTIAVKSAYAFTALNKGGSTGILRRFLKSDLPDVRTMAAVGILTGGDITDIIGSEGYR